MKNNSQKIKLLFITYTHSGGGGAEKVLTALSNSLDENKYDITIQEVYSFGVKKEPLNENIKMLKPMIKNKQERGFVKRFKRYCIENYPELFRSIYSLNYYDVIITWNYQCPSCLLPAFADKKTISWFHGAVDDLDLPPENTVKHLVYFNALQKKAWRFADKIITISNNSLKSLEKIFPEYSYKSGIIHNGAEYEIIRKKAAEPASQDFTGFDFPFLICIGRLDENKNFSLVIKSASILNKAGVPCGLLIAGDGKEKVKLKKLAEEEGIKNKVFFLGYLQNPLPYLAEAKLLCISSLSEGFPTVAVEAMVLGKPFVTTPVAGASEELSDGGKCGIVSGWNPEEYADKIKKLLTDEKLYSDMSNNCIEKIKQFSIENTVLQFDNLIASLSSKEHSEKHIIEKEEALKKLKKLYVWNTGFALQRFQFSADKFLKKASALIFFKTCFHLCNFLIYTAFTPIRLLKNIKGIA